MPGSYTLTHVGIIFFRLSASSLRYENIPDALSMTAATQCGCDLNMMNPFSMHLIAQKHLGMRHLSWWFASPW